MSTHSAAGGQGSNPEIWPDVVRVLAGKLYINYIVYSCMYKIPRAWRRVVTQPGEIKRETNSHLRAGDGARGRDWHSTVWLSYILVVARSAAAGLFRLASASPDAYYTKYTSFIEPRAQTALGRRARSHLAPIIPELGVSARVLRTVVPIDCIGPRFPSTVNGFRARRRRPSASGRPSPPRKRGSHIVPATDVRAPSAARGASQSHLPHPS
jgi:hypothetical protein